MVHHLTLRLFPAVLLLAGSCSSAYEVVFQVSLAADVEVPPGVFIAFAVVEGMPIEHATSRAQVAVTQGVRSYQGKASACCAPNPTVELHAFIDLDGDHKLGPGEPRGTDPNNPVQLTDTTTAYRSAIVITRAPESL